MRSATISGVGLPARSAIARTQMMTAGPRSSRAASGSAVDHRRRRSIFVGSEALTVLQATVCNCTGNTHRRRRELAALLNARPLRC